MKNKMIIEITTNKKTRFGVSESAIETVREFLLSNKDKWIKGKEISEQTNYKNIRVIINKLRFEGLPIVSSFRGYKLTTSKNEIEVCYEELRLRALRALSAAKKMKKLI